MIDRVRVDQANQLRHDKPARKVLKSSRWLLLRNRHNLKPEQAVHLKELLAANQSLLCVYVLRGALFLDLQLIGRGHVDCDRFDALGPAFGELFEEGARRLA